ncbi:SapC family protein [Halomonas campisalis]|uniref:SapC family protein n=1 Tax=Billgrantia campisalis TaxID=74661 RepID=A0ABS9PEL2_9GAMM|nr:SapC family protein [Halomonas campisalis]MCG6659879.1 SapC family protein [Halomonas campisalis]MDR5865071.1 SapC family protein [Halomonas campisalis]
MTRWIPLDPATHHEAGWFKYRDYSFAAKDHLVPVAMAEITQVLPWYPVAFAFNEQADRYHLVALLSLQPGRNIYLSPEFKWQAPYVPSQYRGYPFALNGEGQLFIDADSGLFAETQAIGAQPIFEQGELAELTGQVKQFHEKRQQALGTTQKLVDQLHQAGLIKPWAIRWKPKDKVQTLKGYCGIDEATLRSLPPETYAELAHTGALGLAYVQIFSQPRIGDLQFRHRKQPGTGKPSDKAERHLHSVEQTDSLDAFFGEGDDDLEFDFDR